MTGNGYEERVIAEKNLIDLFADILLGDKTGIDLLREIRTRDLTCPVVMVTGSPNFETASEALRLGAFDYIGKAGNTEGPAAYCSPGTEAQRPP